MRRPRLVPRDARDRMIVGLDLPDVASAEKMIGRVGDAATFYKIGMQLVFAGGLSLIGDLLAAEKRVFVDMKLLDIDNTVESAVRSIAALGATLTTIHAYPNAMRAAVKGRGVGGPGLLAVTVLTSLDDADLRSAGYSDGAATLVARRAADARAAGMDGLVCSPLEAASARTAAGPELLIVTPGVRPAGGKAGDQKRVATPASAIAAGADYLVVSRPVTGAGDPRAAAATITAEISAAL